MQLIDYLAIGILVLSFGAQIFLRNISDFARQKIFKIIFWIAIIAIFGVSLYWSFKQYLLWLNPSQQFSFTKFLLPPYQDIGYFLKYAFMRFWMSYLISLVVGLIIFYAAKNLNKKYGGRFFEAGELYILPLSFFLTGHPGWLIHVILILLIGAGFSAYQFWKNKEQTRFSLYYLWLPTAFSVIIISKWLAAASWWLALKP